MERKSVEKYGGEKMKIKKANKAVNPRNGVVMVGVLEEICCQLQTEQLSVLSMVP